MGELLDEDAEGAPPPPRQLPQAPGLRRGGAVLALMPALASGYNGGATSASGEYFTLTGVAVLAAVAFTAGLLFVQRTRVARGRPKARVSPSATTEPSCSAPSPTPSPPGLAPEGDSAVTWPRATSGERIPPFDGICNNDQCHCLMAEHGAVVHVHVDGIDHMALLSKLFVTQGSHEVRLWSANTPSSRQCVWCHCAWCHCVASRVGEAGAQRAVRVEARAMRLWKPSDGRPLACPGCGGATESCCDYDSADGASHRCGAF